jgi:hypothetical protein
VTADAGGIGHLLRTLGARVPVLVPEAPEPAAQRPATARITSLPMISSGAAGRS